MGIIRGLHVLVTALAALSSIGVAQVSNPNVLPQGVVATPPAVGLAYSITLTKHQASVTFSLSQQVPVGSTYAWTFSGCDATPPSSAQQTQVVVGGTAGTITATVTVTPPPPLPVLGPYTGKALLFGGPIVIDSTRTQKLEQRAGTFTVSQPWILEYFGTSYDDAPNTLSAAAVLSQPSGTTFGWSSGGKIQVVPGQDPSTCTVSATGTSERGACSIELTYFCTVGTTRYSIMDSSDNYYHIGSVANTGYRQITCHMPAAVKVTQTTENVVDASNQDDIWNMIDHYTMQLWSQLDPFKDIHVQERFSPAPPGYFDDDQFFEPGDFTWNGSDPGNVYTWISGMAAMAKEPGYLYNAKFVDNLGFKGYDSPIAQPLSLGLPVLDFSHQYFAATTSVKNGDPGIPLDTYGAYCYTDVATHTKSN